MVALPGGTSSNLGPDARARACIDMDSLEAQDASYASPPLAAAVAPFGLAQTSQPPLGWELAENEDLDRDTMPCPPPFA